MVQANMQYQQTTTELIQSLTQRITQDAQAIANLEKQVGQIAMILSERDQDIFPCEPEANPIEQEAFHEQDDVHTTFRSEEDFDHELSELAEGEEKIANSKLEDPLNEPTSQIAITNWSLPADIQAVDEVSNVKMLEANPSPLDIPECYILNTTDSKVPNSFILYEFKDPFELCMFNSLSVRWPRYGGRDNGKKIKKRKKSRALKLKKKQKYAMPHCLVSTPNFKATRWKKGKKKKIHGVVPHFNDPPSST
ncbi:hypothetical protein D8674_033397 [Pyrus ussuriensis x Pyrus communis]|uniref:Uncharacterized protein n=1 Tax=Pyrus ussuriensis x Pyrus communis TaxID=2448454 RepID=A0A5N5HR38_9ROSA|nr:hypothetical protein D8674_033397 [Pyrus ussuriensis x Pyrus communis]